MRSVAIFLLLLSVHCSAQVWPLIRSYGIFDSCPDPLTNHIASRKAYEIFCGDTTKTERSDTITQRFDRNGHLIAIDKFSETNWNHGQSRHRFYYDKKGRIIIDSTFNYQDTLEVTTFEYSRSKVIIHCPPPYVYGDELPTVIINYNDAGKVVSEYRVNKKGDTVHFFNQYDSSSVDIWRHPREEDGELAYSTKTYTKRSGKMAWRYSEFPDAEGFAKAGDLYFYNDSNQLVMNIYRIDDDRIDTTTYFYNGKFLVAEERAVDSHRFVQHTTYKYNERGQLIETTEWTTYSDHDPYGFEVSHYIYNERNLLIEKNVTYQDFGSDEIKPRRCDRWEYTYFD